MTLIGTTITEENIAVVKQQLTSDAHTLLVHVLAKHDEIVKGLDRKTRAALGACYRSTDDKLKKLAIEAILYVVNQKLEASPFVYATETLDWEDNHDLFTGQFFGFSPAKL